MRYPTFVEGWSPPPPAAPPQNLHRDRPPLLIAEEDHSELCRLSVSARSARPRIAELLAEELARARVVARRHLPADVVTMNATIEYRHEVLGHVRRVQLVYPPQADIDARRISILTSIGAGLIGLAEGASLTFSVRPGSQMRLSVLKVRPPGNSCRR